MLRRFSMSPICGPPPCTTTGRMPTWRSSTMSRAKTRGQLRIDHGMAAVFDDETLARVLLHIGQGVGQRLGGLQPVFGVGEVDLGHLARRPIRCWWRKWRGDVAVSRPGNQESLRRRGSVDLRSRAVDHGGQSRARSWSMPVLSAAGDDDLGMRGRRRSSWIGRRARAISSSPAFISSALVMTI